jgi:aspartyl-tRNA synthetase
LAKDCGDYTRSQLDVLTENAKKLGAGGLIWMRVKEDGLEAPIAKFLTDDEKQSIINTLNTEVGDLVLIISGPKQKALTIMGNLRLEMARRLGLFEKELEDKLVWVTDFPLFEWDDETQRYYAMHHPFTSPKDSSVEFLDSDPSKVYAKAYDLVMNGNEIAGGSLRIFNSKLQSKMFKALGISDEEANEKFGFLMNAFKYGAPPHGGIAFGLDRMVMLFAGESSIRDLIAFPKTTSGLSLMDESPSKVSTEQLRELHIKLRS